MLIRASPGATRRETEASGFGAERVTGGGALRESHVARMSGAVERSQHVGWRGVRGSESVGAKE